MLHHFRIGDLPVLFCEKRQKLYGLNPTADQIWQSFARGRTPAQACVELAALGVPDAEAAVFVRDAVISWLSEGQLTPRDVLDDLGQAGHSKRYVQIHDLTVGIDFHGSASSDAFDNVFGQFGTAVSSARVSLSVIGSHGRYFTFEENVPLASCPPEELVPQLKALLTERFVSSVQNAFLVHGAFVVRRDRGLLMCGPPGAGKTTLCVALVGSGYEYRADDIVCIEPNGAAMGVPFAPAVKRDAWPLVAPYAPEIMTSPTYRRGDGQEVRYLPPRISKGPPQAINDILLLAREAGAAAVLESVEPLEIVSTILESAFSVNGAIDGKMLKSFARRIESAGCYRLVYSDLADAIRVIDRLAHE